MNVATLDLPLLDFRPAAASVSQRVKCALAALVVLGSLTGALFLGWGWEDVLQLFSHPARATLLVALMLQFAFSVAQARPLARPREYLQSRFARILFRVLATASLLIVASSAFWDRRILFVLPGEDLTRYVGLGLFLMALAINFWQRSSMEAWLGGVPFAGHRWSKKDLIRLFSHSLQPGLIVAAVGLPMVFLSKLGLAGGALFVTLSIARAVWNVRSLCANERVSEGRLEAA